jgi:hypothetical protein
MTRSRPNAPQVAHRSRSSAALLEGTFLDQPLSRLAWRDSAVGAPACIRRIGHERDQRGSIGRIHRRDDSSDSCSYSRVGQALRQHAKLTMIDPVDTILAAHGLTGAWTVLNATGQSLRLIERPEGLKV